MVTPAGTSPLLGACSTARAAAALIALQDAVCVQVAGSILDVKLNQGITNIGGAITVIGK
jgi:hypothetical protein